MFFKKFFVGVLLIFGLNVNITFASPIGTVSDILIMQVEALSDTAKKNANLVAENANAQIQGIYDLAEYNGFAYDASDPDSLIKIVNHIYEHPIFASRAGLTTSLNGVAELAEDITIVNTIISEVQSIVGAGIDIVKAAKEIKTLIGSLGKSGRRIHIFNNLLAYGTGNRSQLLTLKQTLEQYSMATNAILLTSKMLEIGYDEYESAKAFASLLYFIKSEYANEQLENIKNGVWGKLVIQDFIMNKWSEVYNLNDNVLSSLNAFSKTSYDCYLAFECPSVGITMASALYAEIDDSTPSTEDIIDFHIIKSQVGTNTYTLSLPEHITNHSSYGVPLSVSYKTAGGVDILANESVEVVFDKIINANGAVTEFTLNMSAKESFEYDVTMEIIVTYATEGNPTQFSFEDLRFIPQVYNLEIIDFPETLTTNDFNLSIKYCGDTSFTAKLKYKNETEDHWQTIPINYDILTNNHEIIDINCSKYKVKVKGWALYRYSGANKDILFKAQVSDKFSPTYTKYVINANDVDNDQMSDRCEETYFGDLSQDADGDYDHDNITNREECENGMDPTKPGSEGVTKTISYEPFQRSDDSWIYECDMESLINAHVTANCNIKLYEDVYVNGTMALNGRYIDLNGYSLTINGNLYHAGGSLKVNNGRLIVKGNYIFDKGDISGQAYSGGNLQMLNDSDYVLVKGDFFMETYGYHVGYKDVDHNLLSAGILEVKGNFTQKNVNEYYKDFYTSGTHKVILSGDKEQIVSFETPSSARSHFNILEITNTSAEGVDFKTAIYIIGGLTATNCQAPLDLTNVTVNGTTILSTSCDAITDTDGDGIPDHEDPNPNDGPLADNDGDGELNKDDLDDDNDGIPDEYELANGLDPLDASDANEDADGDGYSNIEEYEAGTDPNVNPLSLAIVGKTKYFVNTTGNIGERSFVDDGTYAGVTTLADGTTVNVEGTYDVLANLLTIDRLIPSSQTSLLTYINEENEVMYFNLSIDEGAEEQSSFYDTAEERDKNIPSNNINPALILYILN